MLYSFFDDIAQCSPSFDLPVIGQSRGDNDIQAIILGYGAKQVSLIGGAHADEPIGPLFLRKLVTFLRELSADHKLLKLFKWYIVPHINPDGEEQAKLWWSDDHEEVNLVKYLKHVVRELPGDDIEFGYPLKGNTAFLREENKVAFDFWSQNESGFDLHGSFHGMGKSYGPWFLIEESWDDRASKLKANCTLEVRERGFVPFDIDRKGDKGFTRLGKGFCTRPDSNFMKAHFIENGDLVTADKFYPSSMESVRSLSHDCFTFVTEMPLFILPSPVEPDISWPNPDLMAWSEKIAGWRRRCIEGLDKGLPDEITASRVVAMKVEDQMRFQCHLLSESLILIS